MRYIGTVCAPLGCLESEPLRLEIKRKLAQRSERVKSVDLHPSEPWILVSLYSGTVCIWNYQSQTMAKSFEVTELPVRSAKFIARKQWVVAGADDMYIPFMCTQLSALHGNWNIYILIEVAHLFEMVFQHLCKNIWLENTLNYGLERVWAVGYMKGSRRIVIGYDEGTIMVKIGREEPVASMDNSGKIIWAKHNEIQTVNIKSVGADFEVTDGERLPLAVKELGTCDLYPQTLKHNPNGRFVVVCGDGEYIIYTALAWRNRSFGSALEFVWSADGEYAVRESTSKIKIFSKNFQEKKSIRPTFSAERIYGGTLLAMCSNDFICFYDWAECRLIRRIDVTVKNLYWADSGDLVAIASDTSFYILKYNREIVSSYFDSGKPVDEQELAYGLGIVFIYNNSSWRLNYCVGGEVTTMYHLDRPMYLLGYLASQSRVYLIDKEFNVMGYTLLLSLIEYKTLVMRGDLERASEVLPSIPKEHHNSVARFLESRGMIEDALEVATDLDYRFELAIQLGRLEVAKEIASEVQSESKWKQLGELAMSNGKLEMAEECMGHATDLSGLLLLYSSLGDSEGISKLGSLAKEQGKINVAFLCLFMLGKVEDCLQLLVESNRIPEAALMARSYLPSKVSEIVAIWRKDLNKVNPKAAESLADPEEYPNMFDDWQVALSVESRAAETRGVLPPAEDYQNHADKPHITLVEAFRNMQVEEEEPLENGDFDHEANEQNGDEHDAEEQNGDEHDAEEQNGDEHDAEEQNGEEGSQEEAVVVDADSTDGAVFVNGNEPEEEWGTNNEGTPSA
ncbi:COATOMER SUBUNIT BETA'-1 [Salix viminalis]|uniref:COATOMER SUBUNIT BETA'-1 n=1 Tax=Salix viminalis TaxID=40686 RepID=A0A9Q0TP85_SALVM|nr:COATOMER SUBUNIT BETA'-1 [Salix viminalis]